MPSFSTSGLVLIREAENLPLPAHARTVNTVVKAIASEKIRKLVPEIPWHVQQLLAAPQASMASGNEREILVMLS